MDISPAFSFPDLWKLLLIGLNAAAVTVVSFLVPIRSFLIFSFCLVMADFYTGIKAAKHRGETPTSDGYRRTVTKLIEYMTVILLAEGFRKVFSVPANLAYVVAGLIALSEMKSIFGHVHTVTGVELWKDFSKFLFDAFEIFKGKRNDRR